MSTASLTDERDPSRPKLESRVGSLWVGWGDARALLVLLAASVAFFWSMIRPFGQRSYVVAGDFSNQFYPFRAFAGEEWWSRRIPLWNPYVYGGHPFQADIQTAVFYPPAMFNAILLGRHAALPFFALEGEIVVHTLLAAAFMYLLARKVVGSVTGSLVAGLAFGFGGFVTSYPAQQLAILETIAWLPLVVLLLELALDPPLSWRWLMAASLAFGVAVLAGHPQSDLFIAYLTEGYLLVRLWRARVGLARAVAALILFPGLTAGVAAVQILPTLQFFGESVRSRMDFATASHGYLLSALWEVLVPLWHGEKALSVGVVALAFAVVGAVVSRRESLAYWTVAGLVALPLSTGGATPLFWLLYSFAPGWNLFRDQERVICVFAFAVALLAARGVAALENAVQGSSTQRLALGLSGIGVILSLGMLATAGAAGWSSGLRSSLLVDLTVMIVLTVVVVTWPRLPTLALPISGALILLVAAENFAINQGNNLGSVPPDPRPRLAATADFMRGFPEPFRVKALNETLFPSNFGTLLGTPMITGDTPFTTRRADDMLSGNPDYKVWQLLNLKFFVTDGGPLGGLRPVFHDGALTTYYLEDSLPRAWAVTSLEVAKDAAEARSMILAPGYHPGNIVVLEQNPSVGSISAGPRPDVKITHLDPQRYEIDADAAQGSMLVLAEQYYPDWHAYRDGAPVPVYRANYLTMAFDLPAGHHHFEIVYQPTPFYVGGAITLAVLALVGFTVLRRNRRLRLTIARPAWWVPIQPTAFWVASLAILAGAFALRIHALDAPNLTGDEWFMLRNHDEGVGWIVHQAHTFEPHPLLYYLGLAGWIEMAGRGEFALRFPSVAFGVILVAALTALGRSLLGGRAGLIAGALAALNPYQLAESQNARNYEMVAAASAVASLLFLRALRGGRRREWVAYGIAMLVALNVHYDAALILASHVAYVLILRTWPIVGKVIRRASAKPPSDMVIQRSWLLTTATIAVVFGAWLVYAWPALAAYHGYFPTPVGIDRVLLRSLATFTFGTLASIRQVLPALGLAVVAGAWLALTRPKSALFLGLYVLLPIAAVSVLFLVRPMYDERYLIVLAPGYLVVLAAGIEGLIRWFWPAGVLLGITAVGLSWPMVQQTYAASLVDRGDYRSMARWVSTYGAADDPIIATGHGQAELFGYYLKDGRKVSIVDDPSKLGIITASLGSHAGVWLLPYWQSDADTAALTMLNRDGISVAERWFVNARADYFATSARLQPSKLTDAVWDDNLHLVGAAQSPARVRPGESILSELRWTTAYSMSTPKVSLRLLDDSGAVVGQSDLAIAIADHIGPGNSMTRLGLFVPPATPPGRYTLVLLPYQTDSGKPLALATDGPHKDGALILGRVDVGQRDRPVAPEEAGVPLVSPFAFPDGLTVLGYDGIAPTATPGEVLSVRLLWREDRALTTDLSRTLEFRSSSGSVVASRTDPILPSFPTSKWSGAQILAERVGLKVPATLDSGSYVISLRLGADGPTMSLGTIGVKGPDRKFAEPAIGQPVGARFGSFATVTRASTAAGSTGPTSSARLTLIWHAQATADRPYTVFVHVLDPSGKIVTQLDRQPANNGRPTDGWVAGEFIVDEYELSFPPDAAPGPYQLEVGLYDSVSGVRVPATLPDGTTSDHVVIPGIGSSG